VLTPDECKIGIMPGNIFKKGSVGVVSRSGTLTYEAVFQTTNEGLGQTTAVGIGGDPVKGTEFIDMLEMFLADDETKSIIMIGEIGGSAEEERRSSSPTRPSAAAPSRWSASSPAAPRLRAAHGPCRRDRVRRQGRRGSKIAAMEAAGIRVSPSPSELGKTLKELLRADCVPAKAGAQFSSASLQEILGSCLRRALRGMMDASNRARTKLGSGRTGRCGARRRAEPRARPDRGDDREGGEGGQAQAASGASPTKPRSAARPRTASAR
jgi:hypothetical protein